AGGDQVMRPGDGQELRPILLQIRLPEKAIAVNDSPFPRRLTASNVEVQVRPAAAAALLAQEAEPLAHLDSLSRPHLRIDGLQMTVAVVPAALVEEVDHIVARLGRSIIVAGQNGLAGGYHKSVGRGDDFDHPFGTADV